MAVSNIRQLTRRQRIASRPFALWLAAAVSSCSAADTPTRESRAGDRTGGEGGGSGTAPLAPTGGAGGGEPGIVVENPNAGSGGSAGAPAVELGDPTTCEEAAKARTYVGCDYWPTLTANGFYDDYGSAPRIFNAGVVVSNIGIRAGKLKVTGKGGFVVERDLPAGEVVTVYLPPTDISYMRPKSLPKPGGGFVQTPAGSQLERQGAYHLTTTIPVIAYLFNPLDYTVSATSGLTTGVDAEGVSAEQRCEANNQFSGKGTGKPCYSYSNDASVLVPSTAMTGNYRVLAHAGGTDRHMIAGADDRPFTAIGESFVAITATADGTKVSFAIGKLGSVLAGRQVAALNAGDTASYDLNAGDVLQLLSRQPESYWQMADVNGNDGNFAGTVITANKPVQVIAGATIANVPNGVKSADHLEETVLPAEVVGRRYAVPRPTRPGGQAGTHEVTLLAQNKAVRLTYTPERPNGCPERLGAGEHGSCGLISSNFEVQGDEPFAVATFLPGSTYYDAKAPVGAPGDPAQSSVIAVEQYRRDYLFVAPNNYDENHALITGAPDASPSVDGAPVTIACEPIGSGSCVWRVQLSSSTGGTHRVRAERPISLQVIGYGAYTSYQYPGGFNLIRIAEPPKPVEVIIK